MSETFKKETSAKIVFHFMAVDSYANHPNLFLRAFAPYYARRNTKKALEIADLTLVRSMRDLEVLKNAYGITAEFLPDAIPESSFSLTKRHSIEFREKFGVVQANIFLFIGRIHKFKGPQILVEALKYLDTTFAAVLIGPDGGYLKKTLDLADKLGVRKRVYTLGYVNEETKIAAIDSAIALINPAIADHVEVYSIVLSEAWARQKPVIATKIGELAYRVNHRVNGLLINPCNPKMLAKAMSELASNQELAETMGRNGQINVFSWKEIAAKSIELYRKL